MKVYTRTGDNGSTSLLGGQRTSKASKRLEAYGTVDELISWLGLIAALPENATKKEELTKIEDRLMHCAAILASGKGATLDKISAPKADDIVLLEKAIDKMEKELKPLRSFILPGGSVPISFIHICRTVCRRAERAILRIDDGEIIDIYLLKYINRLSDYLFVLSRIVEHETSKKQDIWSK